MAKPVGSERFDAGPLERPIARDDICLTDAVNHAIPSYVFIEDERDKANEIAIIERSSRGSVVRAVILPH
jgi:hypothetical protein